MRSFDFSKIRPAVFCVETLAYARDNNEMKILGIAEFLCSKGYMVYADTYINTIFVDAARWKARKTGV